MKFLRNSKEKSGFTLIETLVVVAVVLILAGVALPAYNGIIGLANRTHTVNGLRNMTNAVHLWAADNSSKIPSPLYPGGHVGEMPAYHDLNVGGEPGMWLNGVVYAVIAIGMDNMIAGEEMMLPPDSPLATAGDHLIGTVFESKVSIKADPSETDWYRHTYAMNGNLQYDEINDLNGSSDPWFTEKELSKFVQPKAMLFIDCVRDNIVFSQDTDMLIEALEERHNGKFIMAAFMDGSVRKLTKSEIPTGDVNVDRYASEFWLGMDKTR